jgi:uracil-DNA glycosylase
LDPSPFARCEDCPLRDRPFVSGVGRDAVKYVIVGEAPGGTEVETGVPFSGPSGAFLKTVLVLNGINRNRDAFVTNTVLCRPRLKPNGMDKHPSAPAKKACIDRLIHEIKSHNPDAVLALGKAAAGTLLESKLGIRVLRQRRCQQSRFFAPPVVATFHPAARESNKLAVIGGDIAKLVECGESYRTASP